MAWPKGKPRPPDSGRKKGSKNKLFSRGSLEEQLAAFEDGKGFNVIQEMLNLYTLIHADNPLVATKILCWLGDRLHPAQKPIEIQTQTNNNLYMTMPYEELKAYVAKRLLAEKTNGS